MRTASGSVNSKDLTRRVRTGFQTTRSWPATNSCFRSTADSSSGPSTTLSWNAESAWMVAMSPGCAPRRASRFRSWTESYQVPIGSSTAGYSRVTPR